VVHKIPAEHSAENYQDANDCKHCEVGGGQRRHSQVVAPMRGSSNSSARNRKNSTDVKKRKICTTSVGEFSTFVPFQTLAYADTLVFEQFWGRAARASHDSNRVWTPVLFLASFRAQHSVIGRLLVRGICPVRDHPFEIGKIEEFLLRC
jgi:hypothetical protein